MLGLNSVNDPPPTVIFNMAALKIATKASQATTLPVLLVADYTRRCDQNVSIKVTLEDTDTLKSGDNAPVELTLRNRVSIFGCEKAIHELNSAHPFLLGKNQNVVSVPLNGL